MFSSVIASDGTTSHATLIYVKNLEDDISSSSSMSHDSIQQIESLSTAAICMAGGGDEGEDNWCREYSTSARKDCWIKFIHNLLFRFILLQRVQILNSGVTCHK